MSKYLRSLDDLDNTKGVDLTFLFDKETITSADALKIAGKIAGRKVSLGFMDSTFDKGAFEILANGILSTESVTRSNFEGCGICDSEAALLAEVISKKNVQFMNLTRNHIGDEGAKMLANAIKVNSVQDLFLNDNQIGPGGAVELVKAFSQCNKENIDLSNNRLGNEGAELVAQAVAEQPGKITRLLLLGNGIQEVGDAALAKYLPSSVNDITYQTEEVDFDTFKKKEPLSALIKLAFSKEPLSEKKFTILKPGLNSPRSNPPLTPSIKDIETPLIVSLLGWD